MKLPVSALFVVATSLTTLTTLTSSPARAEGPIEDQADLRRPGAMVGAALAGGYLRCETSSGADCMPSSSNEAGSVILHAGYLTSRSLAIVGQAWFMTHSKDDITVNQGILAAGVRAWLMPSLWLQAGVGIARNTVEIGPDALMLTRESDTVPALTAGLGFELINLRSFGLDLGLYMGRGFYRDDVDIFNTSLGLGATWY